MANEEKTYRVGQILIYYSENTDCCKYCRDSGYGRVTKIKCMLTNIPVRNDDVFNEVFLLDIDTGMPAIIPVRGLEISLVQVESIHAITEKEFKKICGGLSEKLKTEEEYKNIYKRS